jgi:hypothetical protein
MPVEWIFRKATPNNEHYPRSAINNMEEKIIHIENGRLPPSIKYNIDRDMQLVEALRHKPEGRGFDSRWCQWEFSVTKSFRATLWPYGRLSL